MLRPNCPELTVLSPHMDDAVFSLGNLLISSSYQAEVVTVFGKSRYTIGGIGDAEVVTRLRMKEESLALGEAKCRSIVLEIEDASIDGQFECEDDYMDPSLEARSDNRFESAREVVKTYFKECNIVLAPLGIGDQIDHKILRDAAYDVAAYSDRIGFYADWGYELTCDRSALIKAALQQGLLPDPILIPPIFDSQKWKLIECYGSQVDDEMRLLLNRTAKTLGGEMIFASRRAYPRIHAVLSGTFERERECLREF